MVFKGVQDVDKHLITGKSMKMMGSGDKGGGVYGV
jgi:hypothetical protein